MSITALLLLPLSLAFTPEQKARDLPTSISLERTYCFGTCPVYTATIERSGKIHYHGEANVQNMGNVETQTSPRDFERLAAAIRRIGFESFASKYTSNYTDQTSVITTVKWAKRTKEVENYGMNGPDSLWELEEMIDGVVLGSVESQIVRDRPLSAVKPKTGAK